MITKEVYEQIEKNKIHFILFNSAMLLFLGGIFFTFVIPMTEGFSLYSFVIYLIVCFYVSSIYVGLYRQKNWMKVFISVILLHGAGLLWRVALEWGEFGISKYLILPIVTGYILSVPIFITVLYLMINRNQRNKRKWGTS